MTHEDQRRTASKRQSNMPVLAHRQPARKSLGQNAKGVINHSDNPRVKDGKEPAKAQARWAPVPGVKFRRGT